MRTSLLAPLTLFVAFTAAGCGARSELPGADTGDPDCTPLQIGLFGNPGAYDSSEFQQWLAAGGAVVQRVQTTPDEPLSPEALMPFDVVVLDWLTREYTPGEAATLADRVAAGSGLISMTGWNNVLPDDWRANSLLAPLGVAYSGPLLDGPVATLEPHPVTDDLTSVVFKGGYAISDLGDSPSTRTPIAYLSADGGDVPVGFAIEIGSGRAVVWGDEWIEFLSQADTFQPAVWVQMFEWIAPDRCALLPPD